MSFLVWSLVTLIDCDWTACSCGVCSSARPRFLGCPQWCWYLSDVDLFILKWKKKTWRETVSVVLLGICAESWCRFQSGSLGEPGGSESTCISSKKEEVKAVLGLLLIFQVQAAFIGFLGYVQRGRDDGLVSAEMTWSALDMWIRRGMASICLSLAESGTRLGSCNLHKKGWSDGWMLSGWGRSLRAASGCRELQIEVVMCWE